MPACCVSRELEALVWVERLRARLKRTRQSVERNTAWCGRGEDGGGQWSRPRSHEHDSA